MSLYLTPYTLPSFRSIWSPFEAFEPLLAESKGYSTRFELEEETDQAYTLSLSLPGFKREEVSVEVDRDNVLTVRAAREGRNGAGKVELSRSLTLWDEVDSGTITAKLEDGVLKVVALKRAIPKPLQIEVK
jgi:HSP20 family molecular chaperone IbpA